MTLEYAVDRSDPADITRHLMACDLSFTPPLSSRVDLKDYAQKLGANAARFEAWSGPDLIGLVAVYCNAADRAVAFVSNVSVVPEFTGRGVAQHLMASCIDHLRHLKFEKLSLEVDPAAKSALRLYERLGFLPDAPRTPGLISQSLELGGKEQLA